MPLIQGTATGNGFDFNYYSYIASGLCRELSSPANGQVSWNGLTSGSRATYTCNDGYRLIGDKFRTCLSNGIWSGQESTCHLIINCTQTCMFGVYLCVLALNRLPHHFGRVSTLTACPCI